MAALAASGVNDVVELRDIMIIARQESQQMRHHFIGVEHLCIAMLRARDSILARTLSERGLSVPYVIEALRRRVGKGGRHRLWAGVPNTPRVNVVLTIAQELAAEAGRQNITEHDLLIAILDEGDSLALRVLTTLNIDLEELRRDILNADALPAVQAAYVHIELLPTLDVTLSPEVLFLLRQMFSDYDRVRVEDRLAGGHSGALLLLVTPIRDGSEHASLVVKIGPADLILDEAQRFERYIKTTLPPMTARIEERPVSPPLTELVGIKYTLASDGQSAPRSLRTIVQSEPLDGFAQWLRSALYHTYAPRWWAQRRPFRFEAWQEYDALLPPVLEIDYLPHPPADAIHIRYPIRRQRLTQIHYGQTVQIENFIVHRIDRAAHSITLSLGHGSTRALQITVRDLDLESEAYFRGELVESIAGRVVRTRHDSLMAGLAELTPDFDPRDARLILDQKRIPNPFTQYQPVLDHTVTGSISVVHGDLHLGNIMLGVNNTAMLIDFGQSREGHTLFDWAVLEMSLFAELSLPYLDNTWDSARRAAAELLELTPPIIVDPIRLELLVEVRHIVAELLANPKRRDEYWVALAVVALRASLWTTMSVPQRRLMVYVAGVAIGELIDHGAAPDATEFSGLTG
ncbi:Clp protease N-terminal domain-containing protein [Aggregatilineales bacterium SYSU G02658]